MAKKFVDISDIKKADYDYNIIIGGRSNGKTTAIQTQIIIDDYLSTGAQFVKIVRTGIDGFVQYNEHWFSARAIEYAKEKGKKILYKNHRYYINDFNVSNEKFFKTASVLGFVVPLSLQERYKSNNYEGVQNIVFEEFATTEQWRYLPKEIEQFNSLISTVVRLRDGVRCWLIANMISIFNPYFEYFNIHAEGLKTGVLYDFSNSTDGAGVCLEMFESAQETLADVPSILKVKNNSQATGISEYELPYGVIVEDSPFKLYYNLPEFNEWYFLKCKVIVCFSDNEIKRDKKNNIILDTATYCIYSEIYNKQNIYIVKNIDNKEDFNEYGMAVCDISDCAIYKLSDDVRLKYPILPPDFFTGKNVLCGDLQIMEYLTEYFKGVNFKNG